MGALFGRMIVVSLLILPWGGGFVCAAEIRILSYNVQNLFDTVHDRGKNDWEFLPKGTPGKAEGCRRMDIARYRKSCLETDWTGERLQLKLSRIARVVRAAGKGNGPPDLLALMEVENRNVAAKLSRLLGYGDNFVITDGPDPRGIDVAVLFRESSGLVFGASREYPRGRRQPGKGALRHILRVDFTVGNRWPLTLLVNHWPSRKSPEGGRIRAARRLRGIIREISAGGSGRCVVALGDFNTLSPSRTRSSVHPFASILLKGGSLLDLHRLRTEKKGAINPAGTYYHRGKWNLLDRIFVGKNLVDDRGLDVKLASYRIFSPKFVTRSVRGKGGGRVRIPRRYNFNADSPASAGFSDHFAVGVDLKWPR